VPAEDSWHVVDATAPKALEYVPVPQSVHLALSGRPLPVANVPATQREQLLLWTAAKMVE